ncbi:MAG: hypothetical protein E6K60_11475 [Nitrospirae bacterium]|nr:MAG: hypothetical protein E6K60_11475 [Nitrospirota bacterium]
MTITAVALADPYGPPYAVTDMAPFCARCHASTALTQLIDLPQSAAAEESVEAKHLARIRKDAAYKDLSATDREALINAIKWMDEQSSVVIKAPITVKRNSRMEVSVITKGGAGPVVGVSLVDSGVRFQARSIGSTGFQVLGPALVRGPDGKPQPQWAERRLRGSDLGLSTVMITDIHGNAVTKHIDETQTTWILRAPPETGEFKLAAVFFYGTEKAHPLGTVVRNGQAEPRGGISGPSGRIMFSDVINISVR